MSCFAWKLSHLQYVCLCCSMRCITSVKGTEQHTSLLQAVFNRLPETVRGCDLRDKAAAGRGGSSFWLWQTHQSFYVLLLRAKWFDAGVLKTLHRGHDATRRRSYVLSLHPCHACFQWPLTSPVPNSTTLTLTTDIWQHFYLKKTKNNSF